MVDVVDADFERDVLLRSQEVPVVVDLWADWCGPCKTLGPILEAAVAETEGKVELAKVDVDTNPEIAQAFSVQSIPAVFAIRDGQVVDHFVGAQPERVVKEFIARLSPAPSEADILVQTGDEASLRAALELEHDHPAAVIALAELLVGKGQDQEALALLARIPESSETRKVAALARLASQPGGIQDQADVAKRLDTLLEEVKENEAARQEFIDLLETLGPDDPRTAPYRRRLTARLF
jgi:putative thioredoxin